MDTISEIMQLLLAYDDARKEYQRVLRAGGWPVTGPQVGVLRVLARKPGISISELGQTMGIHITTAEGYAKRLAVRGYVLLEEDSKDRRRKVLNITEDGLRLTREVPLGYKSLLVRNLMEASAEEQRAVLTGLKQLINLLSEDN